MLLFQKNGLVRNAYRRLLVLRLLRGGAGPARERCKPSRRPRPALRKGRRALGNDLCAACSATKACLRDYPLAAAPVAHCALTGSLWRPRDAWLSRSCRHLRSGNDAVRNSTTPHVRFVTTTTTRATTRWRARSHTARGGKYGSTSKCSGAA